MAISQPPVFGNDFGLVLGNTTYSVNEANLALSANKQMLMSWFAFTGTVVTPFAAVSAIKQ